MAVIDPHHHLWDLTEIHYPWLEDRNKTAFFGSYAPLAENYTVEDYLADSCHQELTHSVHIQAECDPADPLAETRWLDRLADRHGLPTAIVAYADFVRDDIREVLERHCAFARVRGIRQILNYHRDPCLTYTAHNLLEDDTWRKNFSALAGLDLSFDLQLYPRQMQQAAKLATQHDDILFILNHTGMPVERDDAGIVDWRTGMTKLATCDNVVVKISGLGMTDPEWTTDSIRPFVLETIDLFGVERCMFASNFPVDGLFSNFDILYAAYRAITADFSFSEQAMLFHDNAARYYRL